MSPRRLTRREIVQEDTIQATLTGLYEWSAARKYLLLAGLGLLMLVLIGFYGLDRYREERTQERQMQFAAALDTYHAPTGPEPELPTAAAGAPRFETDEERLEQALEAFDNIARTYPSTAVGQLSSYYLAQIQHQRGESEQAMQTLEELLREPRTAEIRNLAGYLLAHLLQEDNQRERAAELLQEIVNEPASSFPKDATLLKLGLSYEADGKNEQALEAYRRLVTEFPESDYLAEARGRIARLQPRP